MIQINNISFSYGDTSVLENITMKFEPGRIYGLLGENGVGKTTLLTLLCGLKKTDGGEILIDGLNPYDRKPCTLNSIYYLPDEVAPVAMTPETYARNYGKFWEGFDLEKFLTVMKEFENPVDQRMDRMSCGQLKKTYISFALATNARYLLMDEPTNGLDIPSKAQFRSAVTRHTSEDCTIIISTHQVRDMENIIDPVVILDRRDVLLDASIEEITGRLFFDYGTELHPDALYAELLPGMAVQVLRNTSGQESKVSIEALFNAVHAHKEEIKAMFTK